jgi:large subunit ribosomal protein L28e
MVVNNASSDVQWQVIRKNSAFLRRQRGIPKLFSTERFNLRSVNSQRFNGLVNKGSVDIRPSADGKGIIVEVKKKHGAASNPVKARVSATLSGNSRRTIKKVGKTVRNYVPRLTQVAQLRASQILHSQKAYKKRSATARRTKAE